MNKPKSTLQPQDKFVIRLPHGMRDRLAKAAEESGRSMNAEIINRLERSFPSVESVILENRAAEAAMLGEAAAACVETKDEITMRLRSGDVDPIVANELQHRLAVVEAQIKWINDLRGNIIGDSVLIKLAADAKPTEFKSGPTIDSRTRKKRLNSQSKV